jgi:hypothetical protein
MPDLPATKQLLVEGGDARIALDPDGGLNKYGCPPLPDTGLVALGSSTASVVSEAGFAAADRLRDRLILAAEPDANLYARELERVRRELLDLCGISDLAGVATVFAASGTDVHLIAAQLVGAGSASPALAVMVDAGETGSGVPAALAGRHFSAHAALGGEVAAGNAIDGGAALEVATVPVRLPDGTPRPAVDVDAEVEALVTAAAGRRVLLTLVDVSKSGLVAPSPACVLALQGRLSESVEVLVDACQFRIAPATLRAYLERGFMVALTGSKFVTGPSFSGVLLMPAPVAARLRRCALPPALRAYSSRAEWPRDWGSAGVLDDVANFGLLLRWEAALEELRAFHALPQPQVARFLHAFAQAVQQRLGSDPLFEPLPVPQIDRRPLIEAASWDHIQTIFPFLLYHPRTPAGRVPLSRAETAHIYRLLQTDLDIPGARMRFQLGQPVACGSRDGVPVSALRLCASARLVVEALAEGGRNAAAVMGKALAALDKAALLLQSDKMSGPTG